MVFHTQSEAFLILLVILLSNATSKASFPCGLKAKLQQLGRATILVIQKVTPFLWSSPQTLIAQWTQNLSTKIMSTEWCVTPTTKTHQ